MKTLIRMVALALVVVLPAACETSRDGQGDSLFSLNETMEKLEMTPAPSDPFSAILFQQYHRIAKNLAGKRDYSDADYFARKALAVSEGKKVLPETTGYWDLKPSDKTRIEAQRARLVAALDRGARTTRANAAAVAQGRFDCLVEALDEGKSDRVQDCGRAFADHLARIEQAPPPGAAPGMVATTQTKRIAPQQPAGPQRHLYMVLFDFDQTDLSNEAINKLREIASLMRAWPQSRVLIVGHADSSGSVDYNIELSKRRASAVLTALVEAGAPSDRVQVSWRGEGAPAVARSDNTKEPANRRVLLIIDQSGNI